MPVQPPSHVLSSYGLTSSGCHCELLAGGLINATWKLNCNGNKYILQQVNTSVFQNPERIAHNIELLSNHFSRFPDYTFTHPVRDQSGKSCVKAADGNHYRMFRFSDGSHSIDRVESPRQAYEAARQFGKFTALAKDLDVNLLQTTIPDFHDLTFRQLKFEDAIANGDSTRIQESRPLINELRKFNYIVDEYHRIQSNRALPVRVVHHDTKISNVLFNDEGNGLCVIDLDTVMPGYIISDVGDMIRTYVSPSTEEDIDFSKIVIRESFFEALIRGYLEFTRPILTSDELEKLVFAGSFLTYMQSIRFLTDHLNSDKYYGSRYPGHNFNRAMNQLVLLTRLEEKKELLESVVNKLLM